MPVSRFIIQANHPSLPGHFPGRPIVPGVVLLDEILALMSEAPARGVRLAWAKFLAPVLPEQEVSVAWSAQPGGWADFTCEVGGGVVLRGRASTRHSPG